MAALAITKSEAAPLDVLRDMKSAESIEGAPESFGETPDGTRAENTYWVWRNGRRYWVQPRRRRRRRVCRRVRVRGGWRTRCWYQ